MRSSSWVPALRTLPVLIASFWGGACGGIAVETPGDGAEANEDGAEDPGDLLIIDDDTSPPFPIRIPDCAGTEYFVAGHKYWCSIHYFCEENTYEMECDNSSGEVVCSCSRNGEVLSEFPVQISWGENACEDVPERCFDY